ncbi:MAG TPA: GAP family protein, partial [Acidimicrobiia bacterium]|nr:GAP family protein [Acidimicrobiia bacterium]
FIIGGAAAVAQTGVSGADQTVAWVVFTVIASLGVIVPVGIYFAMGERADEALQRLKGSMVRNNTAIMAVLCLIIAAKLIGDAISGFSS